MTVIVGVTAPTRARTDAESHAAGALDVVPVALSVEDQGAAWAGVGSLSLMFLNQQLLPWSWNPKYPWRGSLPIATFENLCCEPSGRLPGVFHSSRLKVHTEQYRHPFAADHVPVTLPCNEPGSSPWLTRGRLAPTLDPARPSLD